MRNKASLKRLELSNYKLKTLLNITQAINNNEATDDLLKKYERILRSELNIGRVLLYSFNNKWECRLASGILGESFNKIKVERDLIQYDEIATLMSTSHKKKLDEFDVIIPVFHKETPLAYVLIGDIDEERDGVSPTIKHLHFIQTLTNVIIVAIENKRLVKENVRQASIKKELELASRMQSMLIPDPNTLPATDKFSVTAYYNPHFEVGGDYYDFIELSEDEFGFCIADVSGKGISAAFLMSNFQASLRALFTSEISLEELIRKLNRTVTLNAKGEKFITLFIGKFNQNTRELSYVNAGHNPPIMFLQKEKQIVYLKDGCIGLGMLEKIPSVKTGNLITSTAAKLLCYTDGLVETVNQDRIEFGTKEIETSLSNRKHIKTVIKDIAKKVDFYKGGKTYFDDISLLGIEFH